MATIAAPCGSRCCLQICLTGECCVTNVTDNDFGMRRSRAIVCINMVPTVNAASSSYANLETQWCTSFDVLCLLRRQSALQLEQLRLQRHKLLAYSCCYQQNCVPSTLPCPTVEQRESALEHAQQSVRDERDLQVLADASNKSAGGARSGMASLMRRAVQQAKAEAAAQAAAGTGQASHATDSGQSAESQGARSAKGKTALTAMVQQPAERTQHEEAEAAAAGPGQEPSPGPDEILHQQAGLADALDDPHPIRLGQQDDAVDPEQLQMSGVSQSSGSSAELQASDADSGCDP